MIIFKVLGLVQWPRIWFILVCLVQAFEANVHTHTAGGWAILPCQLRHNASQTLCSLAGLFVWALIRIRILACQSIITSGFIHITPYPITFVMWKIRCTGSQSWWASPCIMHVYPHHTHREDGVDPPGVTHGCELPCGCRESSPDLLEEQQAPLISEPYLQSLVIDS